MAPAVSSSSRSRTAREMMLTWFSSALAAPILTRLELAVRSRSLASRLAFFAPYTPINQQHDQQAEAHEEALANAQLGQEVHAVQVLVR
jgi:hypothetical protein